MAAMSKDKANMRKYNPWGQHNTSGGTATLIVEVPEV